MSDLSQVKGINARQIKLLQENGVSTAEALAMSTLNIIILQMSRFGLKIKNEIESSGKIQKTLKMNEKELKEHIKKLKQQIFGDKISTIS